jgi:predicted MFS family arabinose efflux permease
MLRPVRRERDRLTIAVYLHMATFGMFLYSLGPCLTALRLEQGTSLTVAGFHGTVYAAGVLTTGACGTRWTVRVGRGVLIRLGVSGVALAVMLLTTTTSVLLTLLATFIGGLGGSVVTNTHSSLLTAHHGEHASQAAISKANAMAALGGVVGPSLVGASLASGAGWRPGLLMTLVPAAAALLYSRATFGGRQPVDPVRQAGRAQRLPAPYWRAWAVLVLCIGIEFTMALWTADFLGQRLHLAVGTAAASLTGMVAGIAAGRLLTPIVLRRIGVMRTLLTSLALTVCGFVAFWAGDRFGVALAGLVVVGVGLAGQYPLNVGRMIAAAEGQLDAATSRASLGSGLAIAVAPFLLATLADTVGYQRAFLVILALVAASTAILVADRAAWRRSAQPLL